MLAGESRGVLAFIDGEAVGWCAYARRIELPRLQRSLNLACDDPEKVWSFYAPRFSMLTSAQPNDAHRALAELERRGYVRAVVTQNIDLLHERAGTRELVEVHGSIRQCECIDCRAVYPLTEVRRMLDGAAVPRCPSCRSVLKPGVVMFGELLPEAAIDRAFELAREAALLLVVGSTLEVTPVGSLPWDTKEAGGAVAIVNPRPDGVRPPRDAEDRRQGRGGAERRRRPARLSLWLRATNSIRRRKGSPTLGRRALHGPLVQDAGAGRADLPLDLVGNSGALAQLVLYDGGVLVWLSGSLGSHFSFSE